MNAGNVTYKKDNTAKVTSDLEVTLGHLLAEGNDDSASLASCAGIVSPLFLLPSPESIDR